MEWVRGWGWWGWGEVGAGWVGVDHIGNRVIPCLNVQRQPQVCSAPAVEVVFSVLSGGASDVSGETGWGKGKLFLFVAERVGGAVGQAL
jgi:hypothetical protein